MAISTSPVQQQTGSQSGSSIAMTISNPAAGNSLVCCVGINPATGSVSSITGGGGGTWAKAGASATNRDCEIWYSLNSSGSGTSITVNLTGSTNAFANVSEWSGLQASGNPVDTAAPNSGSSTTPTTATITPTASLNMLIMGTARTALGTDQTSGPTNGFTNLNVVASTATVFAYLVVTSTTGSYSTGWTFATAVWGAEIAAFLAAVASGGAPATLCMVGVQ